MKYRNGKLRLGIIGCGAIGSRIALSTKKELKNLFKVAALYDIDAVKAARLARGFASARAASSMDELVQSCDIVVEAVNTSATIDIVHRALRAKKSILVMSVGRLLNESSLFALAEKNHCRLILPSGAIAGLDAVKAASLAGITSVTLTSRKPPAGFANNAFLKSRRINLENVKKETVLFNGRVSEAVKRFPQNINVAAALQLACGKGAQLKVRIIADPKVKRNTHEILLEGACGRITTKTENTICPDNPKTSYLAVLSGIQTLKQVFFSVKIGT